MIRLNVVVEGQTEEAFGNRVLTPHLSAHSVFPSFQLTTGAKTSVSRTRKGGWNSYAAVKSHLRRWMKNDHSEEVWFTTMLDLYALPTDFPGWDEAKAIVDPFVKVDFLENIFKEDLESEGFSRFIPYLQLHEFEALLFTSPQHLDWEFLEHEKAIENLLKIASSFESPEHINCGADTAPSKRIIKEIPEYEYRKVSAGPLIANKIGMHNLKDGCKHFGDWINKLENLA